MTEQFKKAIIITDNLEAKIIDMKIVNEYVSICKLAEFTAMEIREQIPMYTGNINPKWKIYDDVVAIIKGRQNGRT